MLSSEDHISGVNVVVAQHIEITKKQFKRIKDIKTNVLTKWRHGLFNRPW